MNRHSIIKNGRLVAAEDAQKPLDKHLALSKGHQQTREADFSSEPVVAKYGFGRYGEKSLYAGYPIEATPTAPSTNGLSYGSALENYPDDQGLVASFTNPRDVLNPTTLGGKSAPVGSSALVNYAGSAYVVTGSGYGPSNSHTTAIHQITPTGFITSKSVDSIGKITGSFEYKSRVFIAFNEGTAFSELREFKGSSSTSMSLVDSTPYAYYIPYYDYIFASTLGDFYYRIDESFNKTTLSKNITTITLQRVVQEDLSSNSGVNNHKGIGFYKESWESGYKAVRLDSHSTLNVSELNFSNTNYATAGSASELRWLRGMKYLSFAPRYATSADNNSTYSAASLEFDPVKPTSRTNLSYSKRVATDTNPDNWLTYLDTELGVQSKLVRIQNHPTINLFIFSNPQKMTSRTAEVFYNYTAPDGKKVIRKMKVFNWNYASNEVKFKEAVFSSGVHYLLGELTTTGTLILLRGS